MTKIIIAGGRDFFNYNLLYHTVSLFIYTQISGEDIEIVEGEAQGADQLGRRFAEARGYAIKKFPITNEDWVKYRRGAGPVRNTEMAKYAAGHWCICFWDGKSHGTADMIKKASRYNIKTTVFDYNGVVRKNILEILNL